MRWDRGHVSRDVVDRRGQSSGVGGAGLIGLFFMLVRSPLGWVGALVVVGALVAYMMFFGGGSPLGVSRDSATAGPKERSEKVEFVSFVLDDIQDTWTKEFETSDKRYQRAKLVVFTDSTSSACGQGRSATGPFYCPVDTQAYIDLGFYDELERRLGAPGDFAQAYVLAHEIGHHVQNLTGQSERVHNAPESAQRGDGGLSVRLELQADCFAGVWGHSANERDLLEIGDIDEALTAAKAIGDDRLQKQSTGTVNPETWSHGSSEQRARWFRRGFESGDPDDCDTFEASRL